MAIDAIIASDLAFCSAEIHLHWQGSREGGATNKEPSLDTKLKLGINAGLHYQSLGTKH
jgi:hypothetical protein